MRFLSLCSGIEAASVAWNPINVVRWIGLRMQIVEDALREIAA